MTDLAQFLLCNICQITKSLCVCVFGCVLAIYPPLLLSTRQTESGVKAGVDAEG